MIRRAFPSLLIPLALLAPAIGIPGCDEKKGDEASVVAPSCKRLNTCDWSVHFVTEPGGRDNGLQDVACPAPSRCIAVGSQWQASRGFAEEWDGGEWKPIAAVDSVLKAISCPTPTWCMAVGNNPPGTWSLQREAAGGDAKWAIRPFAPPVSQKWTELLLNDVSCLSRTICTAAGNFHEVGYENYAARWDGRKWKLEHPPNPKDEIAGPTHGMLGVSCPSPDFCVTVGAFKLLPLIEHWDGRKWEIVAAPHPKGSPSASLESVFCTSESSCMAVGNATVGRVIGPFAERWDGSRWSVVPTPRSNRKGTGILSSVSCPANSFCAAVGGVALPGETETTIAMTWDGRRWIRRPSPDPKPFTQLAGVSCPSRRYCMAVGEAGPDWGAGTPLAAKLTKPGT